MTTKITNCQFCGNDHGVQCPTVKAIEYFPNGKVKRVEFKSAADYAWPMPTMPTSPPYPPQGPTFTTTWGLPQNHGSILPNGG